MDGTSLFCMALWTHKTFCHLFMRKKFQQWKHFESIVMNSWGCSRLSNANSSVLVHNSFRFQTKQTVIFNHKPLKTDCCVLLLLDLSI